MTWRKLSILMSHSSEKRSMSTLKELKAETLSTPKAPEVPDSSSSFTSTTTAGGGGIEAAFAASEASGIGGGGNAVSWLRRRVDSGAETEGPAGAELFEVEARGPVEDILFFILSNTSRL